MNAKSYQVVSASFSRSRDKSTLSQSFAELQEKATLSAGDVFHLPCNATCLHYDEVSKNTVFGGGQTLGVVGSSSRQPLIDLHLELPALFTSEALEIVKIVQPGPLVVIAIEPRRLVAFQFDAHSGRVSDEVSHDGWFTEYNFCLTDDKQSVWGFGNDGFYEFSLVSPQAWRLFSYPFTSKQQGPKRRPPSPQSRQSSATPTESEDEHSAIEQDQQRKISFQSEDSGRGIIPLQAPSERKGVGMEEPMGGQVQAHSVMMMKAQQRNAVEMRPEEHTSKIPLFCTVSEGCRYIVYSAGESINCFDTSSHQIHVISSDRRCNFLSIDSSSGIVFYERAGEDYLMLWSLQEGRPVNGIRTQNGSCVSLVSTPNYTLVGYSNGSIKLFNLKHRHCSPATFEGVNALVRNVYCWEDHLHYLLGDRKTVKVVPVPEVQWTYEFSTEERIVVSEQAKCFITYNPMLAQITRFNQLSYRDSEPLSQILRLESIAGIVFCRNGSQLLTIQDINQRIKVFMLFDVDTGLQLQKAQWTFNNEEWTTVVTCLGLSDCVAVGESSGELCILNVDDIRDAALYTYANATPISALVSNEAGDSVISGYRDGTLVCTTLTLRNARLVVQAQEHFPNLGATVVSMVLSRDESLLITATTASEVYIWNYFDKRISNMISFDSPIHVEISPDNGTLFVSSNRGYMTLWDTTNCFRLGTVPDCRMCFMEKRGKYYWLVGDGKARRTPNPVYRRREVWTSVGSPNLPKWGDYLLRLKDKPEPRYDREFNDYVFGSHQYGILHCYAYYQLVAYYKRALAENAVFLKGTDGVTPLTICLMKRNRMLVEVTLQYLLDQRPVDQGLKYILDCATLAYINKHLPHLLPQIYSTWFVTLKYPDLPSLSEEMEDPVLKGVSPGTPVNPDEFCTVVDASEGKVTTIEFSQFLVPLCLQPGSKSSLRFLFSLLECENQEILGNPCVAHLVDYKWKATRMFVYTQLAFNVITLAFLLVHSVLARDDFTTLILLILLNTLLFLYEVYSLIMSQHYYIKDKWNWVDLLRSALFYTYVGLYLSDGSSTASESMLIIFNVVFWVRGITFFNSFSQTRYMIYLIESVLKDIIPFFIIVIYCLLAFGTLFAIVEQSKVSFLESLLFTYELALGNFEVDDKSAADIALFILCSAFLMILMLNLLISVMGDTFDRIQENKTAADVIKKLELIIEYEWLLSKWNWDKGSETLLTICQESHDEDTELELWEGRVTQITRKISKSKKDIERQIQRLRMENDAQYLRLVREIQAIGEMRSIPQYGYNLVRHINNTHLKIQKYFCQRCPRRFPNKQGLDIHEKSHERPRACSPSEQPQRRTVFLLTDHYKENFETPRVTFNHVRLPSLPPLDPERQQIQTSQPLPLIPSLLPD